jgi:hypothetical protein
MDEDFEVDALPLNSLAVFDAVREKLLFEADVFWARASIGDEVLQVWLDTYQISRAYRKRGNCGIELVVIQTDEQVLLAQQCVTNLRSILLEARKVHSAQDYVRLAEPILLEVQQREQRLERTAYRLSSECLPTVG